MTETFDEVNKTCKVSLNSSYKYSFVRPQAEIERKEPITIDVSDINARLILTGSTTPVSESELVSKFQTKSMEFNCNECGSDVEEDVSFHQALDYLESHTELICKCCENGEHDIDTAEIRDEIDNFNASSDELYGSVECKHCHQDVDVSLKVEVE